MAADQELALAERRGLGLLVSLPSAILIEGTTLDGAPELAILTVAVG